MIPASISFGFDVRRPDLLETRSTEAVLLGIRAGEWQESVALVRSLPPDSTEQKTAKLALPYATWAGEFSRRSASGFLRHAGQCGVDLDELGEKGATAVIQTAVADKHCLAAFRSARGEGVRLLFRVPPCSASEHPAVFDQVADHVRRVYNHDPDSSGSDVCRASFVSFDAGLWFYGSAEILPIKIQKVIHSGMMKAARCVPSQIYAGRLAVTCWTWYGRQHANTKPGPDGSAKTHRSLLELGMAVAFHAERISQRLTEQQINEAFDAWLGEHARQGVTLRCPPEEYRREFITSLQGAKSKPWFQAAAYKWLRWTRHKDFPKEKPPRERVLFAVRQHCAAAGNNEFFLGVRDAALIAGGHFTTGGRILRKLIAEGILEKAGERRQLRHAQTFLLKK